MHVRCAKGIEELAHRWTFDRLAVLEMRSFAVDLRNTRPQLLGHELAHDVSDLAVKLLRVDSVLEPLGGTPAVLRHLGERSPIDAFVEVVEDVVVVGQKIGHYLPRGLALARCAAVGPTRGAGARRKKAGARDASQLAVVAGAPVLFEHGGGDGGRCRGRDDEKQDEDDVGLRVDVSIVMTAIPPGPHVFANGGVPSPNRTAQQLSHLVWTVQRLAHDEPGAVGVGREEAMQLAEDRVEAIGAGRRAARPRCSARGWHRARHGARAPWMENGEARRAC